jgi:hypothetical protein
MKMRYIFIGILLSLITISYGQNKDIWSKWEWLTGEWEGEGSGIPGQGGGVFSFAFDLENNILIRKSHSEYPGENIKTRTIHDDLMVVYLDTEGTPSKSIYFDNEGHTINYNITYSDSSITMTSEASGQNPVFRLVYTKLDDSIVNTRFEMSRDGIKFMTYIEGRSKKVIRK